METIKICGEVRGLYYCPICKTVYHCKKECGCDDNDDMEELIKKIKDLNS